MPCSTLRRARWAREFCRTEPLGSTAWLWFNSCPTSRTPRHWRATSGSRIVGTELVESVWLDATVLASALSGVEAHGAQLRRVTFAGCKLDSVNLRAALLAEVTFEDCAMTDVDLAGAELTNIRFAGTEIRGLRLPRATLKRVDFRGGPAR